MAVVQISKIQVRRGQKLQGSGLPQLASGELGWAIDTRELFIGNGAVSEGAPAVGNTKVLTEYDDLFALADTYTYQADDSYIVTGINSSNSVKRTLQERLDDRVSVRAFGAKGDNSTDDTAALQRAIDQLFLNDATKGSVASRVTLYVEAGTYLISNTLYIPPYATITGEGLDKTVIKQTVNKPAFITVNSSSTPGNPASDSTSTTLNQAKNIVMKSLTIETTAAGAGASNTISADVGTPDTGKALILESCRDSLFEDVAFKGVWTTGTPLTTDNGVVINSLSNAVESANNTFNRCQFVGFGAAVRSKWDINNNIWNQCKFNTLGWGVVFGYGLTIGSTGQKTGPVHNSFKASTFNNIFQRAIWIDHGLHNLSENNKFTLCGVNGGTELNPLYPVITFSRSTNKSVNDFFARTQPLSVGTALHTTPYVPEIEGTSFHKLNYEVVTEFTKVNNIQLFRLPAIENQAFEIDYTMVSLTSRAMRSGTLHIVYDSAGENVEISDDYHYVGVEEYEDAVTFSTDLLNADVGQGDWVNETIIIKVSSLMPDADQSEFKYTITAKKTNI